MNNKLLIPILIKADGDEKVVYKDVSGLSIESLIKLKRCFNGILSDTTMAINEIIKSDILGNTQIRHDTHIKPYKEEKKLEKRKILLRRKKEEDNI